MSANRLPLPDRLMLLLLDVDGKVPSGQYADLLLGGAVLSELILRGRIDIAGQGESVKAGRVFVRSAEPVGDELLDTALRTLIQHPGSRPSSLVRTLVERTTVLERLAAQGIVSASPHRVVGLFPVTSWPTVDDRPALLARQEVQRVVAGIARPDPGTAALILLLLAGRMLHRVLPTDDRKAQRARAKQLTEEIWANVRTQKALQAVADGVTTAMAVVATGE
ncbi:MAG: GPP34 family phosphoprotein [Nakamurella sp.]